MTISRRGLGFVALAIASVVAWFWWRPAWPEVREWLTLEIPWLARLLDTWQALLAFAFYWLTLREPRCGAGVLALWGLYTAVVLVELRMSWLLGVSLVLLGVVALVARPWPNRPVMARCAALAGLAVAVDAIAQ